MERAKRLGMLAAITGNAIFGFSFMFSKMALNVTTPFVMLMWRFVAAFLLLNVVALLFGRRDGDGQPIHWLRFSLRGRDVRPLLWLGAVQPVGYFLCESYGISLTNSVVSGVIIALVPIVALGMGAAFLGEKPGLWQTLFALLSIVGVALLTLEQSAEGEVRALGVVLLFGAVLAGVVFNIISRKASATFSALERTYVMMLVAAVVFAGLAVWECRGDAALLVAPLGNGAFLGALGYLSGLSSIVAFLMLNYANTVLPIARTTSFCNLTTLISLLAGVLFLGEPFGLASAAGSALILGGVWGVQRGRN